MASAASRTPPPVDLSMLLNQAGYALVGRLGAALQELRISVRIYCVLAKAVEGGHTQSRLAELAWLDKTTMVATVDEMERLGLAQRRPAAGDRRLRVIELTDEGRRLLRRADVLVRGVYDEVLADVPAAQRATFVRVLERLVAGPLAAPFHLERPARRRGQRNAA